MRSLDLTGKVVCISGASAGIGAACARTFAEAGCQLALGARRMDRLDTLRTELLQLYPAAQILIQPMDVADPASTAAFCAAVRATYGGCDILINNAGLAIGLDPLLDTTESAAQTMLDTNVMGVVRLVQGLVPSMLERGGGHIVMLGSIAGRYWYAGGSLYCASKAALRSIAGALRIELNGQPIRISTIEPGMVETEFSAVRFGGDRARAEAVYAGLEPLVAEDIADTVWWVCSRPAHVVVDDLLITPIAQAYLMKTHRR